MHIALAIGLCLLGALPLAAVDADTTNAKDRAKGHPSANSIRQSYRARLNDHTVTIMAGSAHATDLAIVQDIAAALDDGEALRVVPMLGKGPAQSLKDVMFMRGVDMGITQANVLKHFAATLEGWQRSPAAQAWIDRAKTTVAADSGTQAHFDNFLAQADMGAASASSQERAKLFRAFVEWNKTQAQN